MKIILRAEHLLALHPLQVNAIQMVAREGRVSRRRLLSEICRDFPSSKCEHYLDALEQQVWLSSEEQLDATLTGGIEKMRYYTIHFSKAKMMTDG
ncbi:MAG: hypothetical protein AAGB19_04665 [Cyanobacteria bacterium P01_F01_bin.3]